MKTSDSQYKLLRKRQVTIAVLGFSGVFSWLYVANIYAWPDYLTITVIIIMCAFIFYSVKNVYLPILCNKCNKEITGMYDAAEAQGCKIAYCPYCAAELSKQHNK